MPGEGSGAQELGTITVVKLSALPAAQNLLVVAIRYDRQVALARDAIFVTTVPSAPAIFLLAALLA